jgi:hypothetical protein
MRFGDPLCKACRGTGQDIGSDGSDGTPMRDGNSLLPCRVCGGSGEGELYAKPKTRAALFAAALLLSGCAVHKPVVPVAPDVVMFDGSRADVAKPKLVCPKGYRLEWTCYGDYCKGDALRLTWLCVKH